ncbi:MAG: PAS domain-containing sensor histidine kinase [Gemmatimonadaceae bacterium]
MTDEESRIDPVLDGAPCGFVSFADDGTLRAVNRTLLEMLGFARAELVGRHVESILSVGSRIFYQTHFFPLLRLQGRAEEIFLLLRTKDGQEVGALANAVRRERGGQWVTDCVLLQVKERRKFEEALLRAKREAEDARAAAEAHRREAEEANRAKSAFLAMMSHELRTPLNAIGGYVQLLEMGIHGPVTNAQTEALAKIVRSQRHLLRLINDVLNLARIEAGRIEYDLEPVALREVVDSVLPMVEPQLAARRLRHEVQVPSELVAYGDRDKVQQILLNLLSNATKFTPAEGCVSVDAFADPEREDRVYVRVRDTGVGIPADRLEQVFEPFVQVDVSHARRAEGTGLGLAISRDLARGMGGDLRARSEQGAGSSFTLSLPSAAVESSGDRTG